ncbi:MAG: hypothetical protein ACE5HZ_00175 [Fidelibacterota bacterium]
MRKLSWIVVFGIAFGLVEAAVVVYLRSIGYPEGFDFAEGRLPPTILNTEIIREGASILALVAIAVLAGKTGLARLGAFITVFGVWDLFYYVWLKVFLGWPESLMDGDILFLIPGVWAGPVLAPILVSVAFVGCGGWIYWREETGRPVRTGPIDWIVEAGGGLAIVTSFLVSDIVPGSEPGPDYISSFPWWLFLAGFLGGLGYFVWRIFRQ